MMNNTPKKIIALILLLALPALYLNAEDVSIDLMDQYVPPSLVEMDLQSEITDEDLMQSGQLGGILYPKRTRLKWRSSNTIKRQQKLQPKTLHPPYKRGTSTNTKAHTISLTASGRHILTNPWTGEAILHMGCEARFNGRYNEAGELFDDVISKYKSSAYKGAKLLTAKAKLRKGVLKVMENNPDEARKIFIDLSKSDSDWRHRTYATNWLRKLSSFNDDNYALYNCGTLALGHILDKEGRSSDADEVMAYTPSSKKGFSIQQMLDLSEQYGYQAQASKLTLDELKQLPLPAILQISRNDEESAGHYWVLEELQKGEAVIYDAQKIVDLDSHLVSYLKSGRVMPLPFIKTSQ